MHTAMLDVQDRVVQYGISLQKQLKKLFFPQKEEIPIEIWKDLIQMIKLNHKFNIPSEDIVRDVLTSDKWPLFHEIPDECLMFYKDLAILCWAMNLNSVPIRMISFDDHPEWYNIDEWAKPRSFPGLLFFNYPALIGIEGTIVYKGQISPFNEHIIP